MGALRLGARQASMVWLEPHRVHAGGRDHALSGPVATESLVAVLASALGDQPLGPTHWVVDDPWLPCLLLRDIVEVPSGAEARDGFFKWRFGQSLALEAPQVVQSLPLGENAWLLAGMDEATRESWLQASITLGRPIRSLLPRWLWLYNRIAATRETPGMLLSLCPAGADAYTGTLAAWGRNLVLLRQWTDPATPAEWNEERVLPSAAYLQRESRHPHELLVWGAPHWPGSPVPVQLLPAGIPVQEAL